MLASNGSFLTGGLLLRISQSKNATRPQTREKKIVPINRESTSLVTSPRRRNMVSLKQVNAANSTACRLFGGQYSKSGESSNSIA